MLNKINSVLERHYKSKPWFLISLAALVLFFVAPDPNKIATDYEKLFAAIGSVGSVFIGFGAYQLAKKQQMNLDYKISEEEKRIIRQNYKKLTEAINLIARHGQITDEAMRLFWEVEYEAKLELPKDIENYTSKIRELALKGFSKKPLRENERRVEEKKRLFDEDCKIKIKLLEEKPEEIYSKYLKLK